MIYHQPGEEFWHEGVCYKVGGRIVANEASDYAGLFGNILEIRTVANHWHSLTDIGQCRCHAGCKRVALGACGGQNRLDADLGEEGAHADHQILFTIDEGPFAEHVLVAIDIGIDQTAALLDILLRSRSTAQLL
mgnify:CR=1 FL=1